MKCFVIMPYGNRENEQRRQQLDALYEHFIRPAVDAVPIPGQPDKHVICHRGDKEPGPGEIITHIIENLVLSEVAIADLTGRNPNVFYELGVRHAVNDNTILISENEEDVPFDLRGLRLIIYKRDFEGGGRLRNEITRAVQEIVRAPSKIDSPVRRFLFDRERDKMLKNIEEQGRPPGYDFVNQLLQEMSNLRKEFRGQLDDVRQIMMAVTTTQPTNSPRMVEDLAFLEGAWQSPSSRSHLYARMIGGQLLVPYCFSGNNSLSAHLYNLRLIGDRLFARFEWLPARDLAGFAQFRIENPDRLVGGWWISEDAVDERDDITTISVPSMHAWELHRVRGKIVVPDWAEDYFRNRQAALLR